MKTELIKTDKYLLVVDDSEIKFREWFINPKPGYEPKRFVQRGAFEAVSHKCNKVIAHLPLNDAPILEGVPLLPPFSRHQEDGLEELVKEHFELNKELNNPSSFKAGYNKAKEKLDEVLKWIDEEILLNPYYKDSPRLKEGASMVKVKIQSLSQSNTPTHFEFEMKQKSLNGSIPVNQEWEFEPKTTINAQGQQVACGKYIY